MILLTVALIIFILSRVAVHYAKKMRDKVDLTIAGGRTQVFELNKFIDILNGQLWRMKK